MSLVIQELAQTELFQDVAEEVIRQVSERATVQELAAGEVLLSPERDSDCVYMLLSGVLTIHFGLPDSPPIRELTKGASVGEMSVIDSSPPSAYVVAKEPSRVFPIHRDLLQYLLGQSNPVGRNLIQMLSRWIKSNTDRIVKDRLHISELTDHANVDRLTGLYNRRWLENALGRLIAKSGNGKQPLCILMLDVDHFKRYNDTQGHLGGDQALIAFGNVLKTTIRPFDFATRFGGEEFLLILPNTTQEEGFAAAERIRVATEKMEIQTVDGLPLPGITVSIGLAMCQGDASAESAIAAADSKLYEAKKDGRNCVRGPGPADIAEH